MSCKIYLCAMVSNLRLLYTSTAHSLKGWTDQELGSQWLENDLEPQSALRNKTGGYHLLILDGHNSHCTLCFAEFAEKHRILIVCLPPHTPHTLQPCDVRIFSPLASSWKKQVNIASRNYIPIHKHNFLLYYHTAQTIAFKKSTIISAFAKTSIYPLNPDAIDPVSFEPAKNTSTKAAQPMPALLLSILEPIHEDSPLSSRAPSPSPSNPSTSHASSSTSIMNPSSTVPNAGSDLSTLCYQLRGLPQPNPHTTARNILYHENVQLRAMIYHLQSELERQYAQNVLMDL